MMYSIYRPFLCTILLFHPFTFSFISSLPRDHFFTRVYPSNPASCPKGVGKVESPRNTALPTTRGHETILNKKVVMSFTKGNRPSNAMKRHHHHAQNHARGHAMKKRRRAQTRLYKRFFSAILMSLLEYFTEQ